MIYFSNIFRILADSREEAVLRSRHEPEFKRAWEAYLESPDLKVGRKCALQLNQRPVGVCGKMMFSYYINAVKFFALSTLAGNYVYHSHEVRLNRRLINFPQEIRVIKLLPELLPIEYRSVSRELGKVDVTHLQGKLIFTKQGEVYHRAEVEIYNHSRIIDWFQN